MINSPDFTSLLLVNENDEIVGTAEKLAVHQTGDLHRAFSVLVFDGNGSSSIGTPFHLLDKMYVRAWQEQYWKYSIEIFFRAIKVKKHYK